MIGSLVSVLSPLADPVAEALVHFLWQGGLIALLLSGVLQLLKNHSADLRYRWACWALLLMVALPVGTTAWHLLNNDFSVPASTGGAVLDDAAPSVGTVQNTAETEIATTGSSARGLVARRISARIPHVNWICAVWLCGVLLLSLMHLGGWFRVQRLRWHRAKPVGQEWQAVADRLCDRLGMKRAVSVLSSAAVEIPTAFGYLRPVVLVPVATLAGLPPKQVECLIAHELAHIWRRDYLVNLLQILAETLLFYHPAVWWISQQIRVERENACDDIAVELTSDRLAYARALVDLEELRLASPRLVLGADGGSLVRRISRIVGGSNMKTSPYRPLLAAALAVALILGISVIGMAAQSTQRNSDDDNDSLISGRWTAEWERGDDDVQLRLQLRRGKGNMGTHVPIDDFTGLEFEEDADFSLRRDAGIYTFSGDFERDGRFQEGGGRYSFEVNEDYVQDLEDLHVHGLDDEKLMVLALQDFRVATLEGLNDLGYRRMDADELVSIAIFDVTPAFVDEMTDAGFDDLDMDMLVAMRVHDVDADFAEEMEDAGFDLDDADDLISLAVHDLSPEYAAEMQRLGFGELSSEELLACKIHDIDAEFLEDLHAANLPIDDMDEVMAFRIHDIDADFIEELRAAGLPTDDVDEIMSFRIHDVDADFVEDLRAAGLDVDDADDILSYRIHGIDKEFARTARKHFGDMDGEELLSMKIHGVDADFIEGLAELGYTDVDFEDLLTCKIHGVTPRYIRSLEKKGLRKFTLEELVRLRISGVEL